MVTGLALATYQEDQEVLEVQTQARTIADDARELVIADEATNSRALDMLSQCRKASKRIDALKKRWLDPLNDQIKLIRSDFDAMAAPAKEADQILSRKTSDYRMKVQEAARKEQERLGRETPGAGGSQGCGTRSRAALRYPLGSHGSRPGKDGRYRVGHRDLPQADPHGNHGRERGSP